MNPQASDEAIAVAFASFEDELDGSDDARRFAEELVRGTLEHLSDIDEAIRASSTNWRLERMGRVDRAVLRLATHELLHRPDTPARVVLNEAVELAKRFGAEDSGAFVNGVLDHLARAHGGDPA
jgi:N utilization substance protein B